MTNVELYLLYSYISICLHQFCLFDSAVSNDWDCSEYKCLGEHLDGSQALPASVIFPACPQIARQTFHQPPLVAFLLPGERDKPDGGGRLEDVEVLQDVWNCHQAQGSQEPES